MTRKGGPAWTRFPASTSGQCRESAELAGRGHTHYQWGDEERTRVTVRWLKDYARSKRRRPFAAVLGYVLPHCPFVAPKPLFDYYYERVDIPTVEQRQPATIRRWRDIRGVLDPPLPQERIRVARAACYGLCEHIDSLIGQVLDAEGNADGRPEIVLDFSGAGKGDRIVLSWDGIYMTEVYNDPQVPIRAWIGAIIDE